MGSGEKEATIRDCIARTGKESKAIEPFADSSASEEFGDGGLPVGAARGGVLRCGWPVLRGD